MKFWKILGGVAVVAAAPFTGGASLVALGATGVALATTGVAGAGAVAAASKAKKNYDNRLKSEGYDEGVQETTAKYDLKMKKVVDSLEEFKSAQTDNNQYFKLLIAMVAVGMATAYADGCVTEEEIVDLEEFSAGIGHSKLPPHIKGAITRLKNNPPTFNTAMQYVKKLDKVDIGLFESVIQLVAESDGHVCEDEKALLAAFRQAAA